MILSDGNMRFPLTEPCPTRRLASPSETRRGLPGGRSLTVYFYPDRFGTLSGRRTARPGSTRTGVRVATGALRNRGSQKEVLDRTWRRRGHRRASIATSDCKGTGPATVMLVANVSLPSGRSAILKPRPTLHIGPCVREERPTDISQCCEAGRMTLGYLRVCASQRRSRRKTLHFNLLRNPRPTTTLAGRNRSVMG